MANVKSIFLARFIVLALFLIEFGITPLAHPETTGRVRDHHNLTQYLADKQSRALGFANYDAFTQANLATQLYLDEQGLSPLAALSPATNASFPVLASRLHSNDTFDCHTKDNQCWTISEEFSGTWVDSAGVFIELHPLTTSIGISFNPTTNPYGSSTWVPNYIWEDPSTGKGYTCPSIGMDHSRCELLDVITASDGLILTNNKLSGYTNMGNNAWGIWDSQQQPEQPYPQGLAGYGALSPIGAFDSNISNVGINPVHTSYDPPPGTFVECSTPHGLVSGTLGTVFSAAYPQWNSGNPPFVGGTDYTYGTVGLQAYSNPVAPHPGRFWFMTVGFSQFISGDVHSNCYITAYDASNHICMAPLGDIVGTPSYGTLQSPRGPLIEAFHPNMTWPYFVRTGKNIQPTGSCNNTHF